MFNFLKDLGFPPFYVGVLGLFFLLSVTYKKIKEFQELRLNTNKEQLDSITDLFTNKKKLKNKFLVEQVFQYKFKSYISARVIFCLIETGNPTSTINDYIFGRIYLKYEAGDENITFTEKMECRRHRKKWYIINIIGYFVFAFLGVYLLFYLPKISKSVEFPVLLTLMPLVVLFLFYAYSFVMSALKITAAERVIKEVEFIEIANKKLGGCEQNRC